jgi:hypothetical protein
MMTMMVLVVTQFFTLNVLAQIIIILIIKIITTLVFTKDGNFSVFNICWHANSFYISLFWFQLEDTHGLMV